MVTRIPRVPREPGTPTKRRGRVKGSPRNPGSGRKKGTRNKITMDLKEASLLAACMHGSDGKGKDALVGAMFRLFKDYPETYTREILGKILPANLLAQVATTVVQASTVRLTREELIAQLQARGINVASINLDKSQYLSDRNVLPSPIRNGPQNGNGSSSSGGNGSGNPSGDS